MNPIKCKINAALISGSVYPGVVPEPCALTSSAEINKNIKKIDRGLTDDPCAKVQVQPDDLT
jgi:hypothetical protein